MSETQTLQLKINLIKNILTICQKQIALSSQLLKSIRSHTLPDFLKTTGSLTVKCLLWALPNNAEGNI